MFEVKSSQRGFSRSITIMNQAGKYEGPISRSGKAHGMGTFTLDDGSVYKGIFLQNKMESYCHFTNSKGEVWAGEMKNSLWDGAVT